MLFRSKGWDAKLLLLLALMPEIPAEGPPRALLLTSIDSLVAEMLNGSAALADLLGHNPDLGHALMNLTELFLGTTVNVGALLGMIEALQKGGSAKPDAALIERRRRSQNGLVALAQTRRRVHRIQYNELVDVVEIWVDSALRLTTRDLKLMNRLVSRQNGLGESQ